MMIILQSTRPAAFSYKQAWMWRRRGWWRWCRRRYLGVKICACIMSNDARDALADVLAHFSITCVSQRLG